MIIHSWGSPNRSRRGAELAFTYQGEAQAKRSSAGAALVSHCLSCGVEDIASVDGCSTRLRGKWGRLDFLVNAIGFATEELRVVMRTTTRENFLRTMLISCFSFTRSPSGRSS